MAGGSGTYLPLLIPVITGHYVAEETDNGD